VIDVVGVGASPYDFLKERDVPVFGFSAGMSAVDPNGKILTDRTGIIGFNNLRSWIWWDTRDWLDPSNYQEGEAMPELPPGEELFAELTAPRWGKSSITAAQYEVGIKLCIQVEDKEKVKTRLDGRSTDQADAVIMSRVEWSEADDPVGWISKM